MVTPMSGSQERVSVSMTSDDRALIETAARAAGLSVSAWIAQTAREEDLGPRRDTRASDLRAGSGPGDRTSG